MTLKLSVYDPTTGQSCRVVQDGQMVVVSTGLPPPDTESLAFPFGLFMTDEAGSFDMRVAGSLLTPFEFALRAQKLDVYIQTVNITIADNMASLQQFGAIGALTNGIEFLWRRRDEAEVLLAPPLQTNYDFVRLAGGEPAFGTRDDAFLGRNVIGTSEAYFSSINFQTRFGMPHGLLLRANTTERLVFRITDDLTGVDEFDALVTGKVIDKR